MMKKLLTILVIAAAGVTGAYAQCTPDVSCIPPGQGYGICPDSAHGLPAGTVGVAYNQTMSIKVPTDGSDFGYSSATITNITITSVDSLAPGLSYTCVPSGCVFPGGSNGCILISGTPTTVWNKKIIVNAVANATIFGFPASLPQTNEQYRSVVNSVAGVESLDLEKFELGQNKPNPFNATSEINFTSASPATVEFRVFNMLGSVVYAKNIRAEKGLNTIELDGNAFPQGIYMYSLKNGDKTITKRMIVTK